MIRSGLFWSKTFVPSQSDRLTFSSTLFTIYFFNRNDLNVWLLVDCLADRLIWRFVCLADGRSLFLKAALVVSATVSLGFLLTAVLVVYLDFLLMAVLVVTAGCLPCRLVDGCTPCLLDGCTCCLRLAILPSYILLDTLGGAVGRLKSLPPYVLL
jgi:hypothetical protein